MLLNQDSSRKKGQRSSRTVLTPISARRERVIQILGLAKRMAKIFVVVGSLLGTVFMVRPSTPYHAYQFQVGEVSNIEILAPVDLEILDQERTLLMQEQAKGQVVPIYEESSDAYKQCLKDLETVLQTAGQALPQPTQEQELSRKFLQERFRLKLDRVQFENLLRYASSQSEISRVLKDFFENLMNGGIVETEQDLIRMQQKNNGGIDIKLGLEYRHRLSVVGIRSVDEAKQALAQMIDEHFSGRNEPDLQALAVEIGSALIRPTLRYDSADTQKRIDERTKAVGKAVIHIRQGERIIGPHEQVTEEVLAKLEALSKGVASSWFINYTAWILLVFIPYLIGAAYIRKYAPTFWKNPASMPSLAVLTLMIIAMARLASNLPRVGETYAQASFAIPIGLAGTILTVLVNGQLATFWCMILCLLVGPLLNWDLREITVLFLGSVCGILGVVGVTKRTDLYKAFLWISGGCAITYLALSLSSKSSIAEVLGSGNQVFYAIVPCVLNGAISALVAIALLPIYEDWLGITTDIKLLEVQMKTGILKELAERAPGTYQHCQNVSLLAESAADVIGANSLLTRVGALYHDVGKIAKPSYFSENQLSEADKKKHSKLSPNMSCFIIRNHIKDGLDLSRKHKLPKIISDFIAQHHGTTLLTYFYDQALDEDDKDTVQEENYRYAGPKPQFKESAIVMLADSIEAASRSLPPLMEGELKQFVRKIVNDKFMDDQFDECDLTMHDLHLLSDSFARSLSSLMHRRVKYPTAEEIAEKEKGRPAENAKHEETRGMEVQPIMKEKGEKPTPSPASIDILSEMEGYQPDEEGLTALVERLLNENGRGDSEVSLLFTSNAKIHEMNKTYRNIDAPTNVLSFLQQEASAEVPEVVESEEGLPPSILGDVVISVERAREEAEEAGKTLDERIRELVTHGVNHLLGKHHD